MAEGQERRWHHRRETALRAQAMINGTALPCTVQNVSASGAELTFSSAIALPSEFVLEVLQDTLAGAVGKLAPGNIGAASVLGRIMKDPFGGLMILVDLESLGLRGEAIWQLYRDVHLMKLESFIQHIKAQADEARLLGA